jgi:hypothetical protein
MGLVPKPIMVEVSATSAVFWVADGAIEQVEEANPGEERGEYPPPPQQLGLATSLHRLSHPLCRRWRGNK